MNSSDSAPSTATAFDFAALTRRFVVCQLHGDREGALRIVLDEGLKAGATVEDVLLRVIQAAQHEIGRLWQEDRISIADEHQATAIAQLVMAHLYPYLARRAFTGKKVVVACVEGELHDLGARVCGDVLDSNGFEVRLLGANVPKESLVGFLKRSPPDLLALSVTMSFHEPALRETVKAVRAALPELPIAVGGRALEGNSRLLPDLKVEVFGADAVQLVTAARRALGLGSTDS